MKRLLLLLSMVALMAPGAVVRAAGPTGAPQFGDGHKLHVLDVKQFSDRDYNVSVLSPDLGRPIDIRLLLPVGYAAHPKQHYPVLYLFHGTSGVASDWVKAGDATKATAPYQLITVMPEVGFGGDGGFWFTNWVDQTTSHGPSQFEDYLINSLIPWVDQNLRTVQDRRGRAA